MSTRSPEGIYACSTVLPVLSTVFVSLRFYVRSKQKVKLQFDDWAQIPALAILIAMAVIAIVGVEARAFGYPQPVTDPVGEAPSTILVEKLWLTLQTIQIPGLALVKIAALQFYRRIFVAGTREILYYVIWILTVIVAAWAIAFIVFYLTSCGSEFSAAWSGIIGFLAHCRRTQDFNLGYAISNFLLDTLILIVPIPSIWKLQTSFARKIGITGVFMLALIGYGASIARMVAYIRLVYTTLATTPPDVQLQDTEATWYSMLELGLSIIALNLPSLWGLFASITVDSVVRNVRSVFSLHSGHDKSAGSHQWTELAHKDKAQVSSGTSNSDYGPESAKGIENFELMMNGQKVNLGDESCGERTYREVLEQSKDLEMGVKSHNGAKA